MSQHIVRLTHQTGPVPFVWHALCGVIPAPDGTLRPEDSPRHVVDIWARKVGSGVAVARIECPVCRDRYRDGTGTEGK